MGVAARRGGNLVLQLQLLVCGWDRLHARPGFRAKRAKEERKDIPSAPPSSSAEALLKNEPAVKPSRAGAPSLRTFARLARNPNYRLQSGRAGRHPGGNCNCSTNALPSVSMVELLLQRRVVFTAKDPGRRRLAQPNYVGYASTAPKTLESGTPLPISHDTVLMQAPPEVNILPWCGHAKDVRSRKAAYQAAAAHPCHPLRARPRAEPHDVGPMKPPTVRADHAEGSLVKAHAFKGIECHHWFRSPEIWPWFSAPEKAWLRIGSTPWANRPHVGRPTVLLALSAGQRAEIEMAMRPEKAERRIRSRPGAGAGGVALRDRPRLAYPPCQDPTNEQ
jgi:hypothetical protein